MVVSERVVQTKLDIYVFI